MRHFCFLFLFLLLVGAKAQDTSLTDSVIVIGIKSSPPFVDIREGFAPEGLSLEFWSEVEGEAQVLYEFRQFQDLDQLLAALRAGEIDMSINPITVTEQRMREMDFAQPFYISGTTLVRKDNSGWMGVLRNLFSWQFFSALAGLLLVIFIFGFILWLFERKKNKEQFGSGLKGLADGFWWSAVTMTTVGYGDKAPITTGGRIIGFVWMFAAILLISGLTASIASALTVSSLDARVSSPEDLRRYSVGCIPGSSSATYLELFNVNFIDFATVEEGLQAVEDDRIDMFVYDRPILKYHLNQGDYEDLTLNTRDLKTDYYSFTYPKGSALQDFLNPFIVRALRSERWNYRLKSETE